MEAVVKIGRMVRNLKTLSQMVFNRGKLGWLLFPNSRRNYASKVDMLAANVVMAPVLWIARQFTEARLAIGDAGETIHDHALLALVRRPNRFYSGLLLWFATIVSLIIDGNAYWIIVRNAQLKPVELWYVPHWLMDPRSESESEFIEYYRYTPAGRQIRLDPDDVVHFRYGLDPDNTRKGLSPLKPAMREVFTDEEAANFSASILVNGGVPGLLISPDGESDISPDDAEAVKAYVKEKYTRDNRGEPMVMSGPTRVQEFGFSPEKLNLSAIRNIPEERITALLGVPAAIVGFGTGLEQATQNATMQTLRRVAFESAVVPIQRLVAEELQIQLLGDFEPNPDRVDVMFDNSAVRVMQEDENALWKRLNLGVAGGWLKVTDAQALVGLEPDETQDGYLRRVGTTFSPAGIAPSPEGQSGEGGGKMLGAQRKGIEEAAQRFADRMAVDAQELSAAFASELAGRLDEYGERAATLYAEVAESQGLAAAAPAQRKDSTLDDEIIVGLVIDKLAESVDQAAVLGFSAYYLRVARATVDGINATLGVAVDLSDPMEQRIVRAGGTRMGLVDLAADAKDELLQVLAEARENGYAADKLAREIRSRVPAGPWKDAKTRSKVIARTETKYAQNVSSIVAAAGSGAVAVQIVDGQLPTSCEICIERNGMIVSVSEAEMIAAAEHPNGTMSLVPLYDPQAADRITPAAQVPQR